MALGPTSIPILWTDMTTSLGMNLTIDKFVVCEIPKHKDLRQTPHKLQTDGDVRKNEGNYMILTIFSSYV
jgi:hypothetical protein